MDGKSTGTDPAEPRVAWIATRKALEVASAALGKRLLSSHLLHDMLHVKSTLPELNAASLVATELPVEVEGGYEQTVYHLQSGHFRNAPGCS